jgi:hypothetical protein
MDGGIEERLANLHCTGGFDRASGVMKANTAVVPRQATIID